MNRYGLRSIVLAIGLSVLAGYVDAIGFLSTGRFFVSFMSGNSTRLAIAFGSGRWESGALACGVIGLFVAGVVIGSLVACRAGTRRKSATLALVALFLAVAAIACSMGHLVPSIAVMVLAMGAENTVFQREGEVSIGVTYMTGALVRLGQRLSAAISGGPRWEWVPYLLLWLGLVFGAILGAFVENRIGPGLGLWGGTSYAVVLAIWAEKNHRRDPGAKAGPIPS
jgi:uncharacterized membrane protein YoaK (UPF0700 family)